MGGQAFASCPDAVTTPRMKPDVYMAMRDRCQDKLRGLFEVVATPIEGPAKTTFGDIDIFVALARKDVFASAGAAPQTPKQAICAVLGAIMSKNANKHAITMAIPWPEDFPYEGEKSEGDGFAANKNGVPRGIQVDVHICETTDELKWMLFKCAHGDLWNILGSMIRGIGLTIDEVGLYIRIPEIEEINKKQAKVLLSKDPDEVMRFLTLDNKQWQAPFASDEAVFEYAATCRFFWLSAHNTETTADADTTETEGASKLKANDRRRMATRPLFRKWIQEYLPARRASGDFPPTPRATREAVCEAAFAEFPGTEEAYNQQQSEWRVKRQREVLVKDVIKPAVPTDIDPNRRGCCIAALKKIILEGNSDDFGVVAPATLRDADGLFDEDAVRAWVAHHWAGVANAAWKANMQRYAASKARKAAVTPDERAGSE